MIQKPQPLTEIVIILYNLGNNCVLHVYIMSHDRAKQFMEEAASYGWISARPGDEASFHQEILGGIAIKSNVKFRQYYCLEINPCFDGREVAIYLGRDGIVYDSANCIIHQFAPGDTVL